MKILFLMINLALFSKLYSNPIVDSDWLSKNLCKENIKVLEVGISYNSYLVEHIQCSQFTNFYKSGWRINKNGINMSMPSVEKLVSLIEDMGFDEKDHIILYSKRNNEYSVAESTAIYFSLKYLGHKKISILNGGYPNFKKKYGLLIDEGIYEIENKSKYDFKINYNILATSEDVISYQKNELTLIDSRESDFYLGINKLNGFDSFGTIEGAMNIPSKWFLKGRGLEFNDLETIEAIYKKKKINKNNKSIFFCYAGLESSVNWFVAHELNKNKNARLFEGSIFEWISKKKSLHKKTLKKHRQ